MSELYTRRPISHKEARESARRLINSHFQLELWNRDYREQIAFLKAKATG